MGELMINKENLGALISKQTKKKDIKKLQVDLFFVNTNKLEKSFTFADKIYIDHGLFKVNYKLNLKLNVEKPKKFLTFTLRELALPRGVDTDKLIQNYLYDLIHSFFLRKNLDSPELDEKILTTLKTKVQKFFNSVGVSLIDFDFQLSTNGTFAPKKIKIFDNTNKNTPKTATVQKESGKTLDQNENIDYNENVTQKVDNPPTAQANICPVCGKTVVQGSIYCHHCGAMLK